VADNERETANVYTEAQHFALLESAVERETASLTEVKSELEAQVASLTTEKAGVVAELDTVKARVDVLEAEKATADAALEAKTKEFDDYKAEQARVERVAALKAERKAKVQSANANLADAYFTDERIQRWAEMADEAFDALVADMTEAAAAVAAPAEETVDKTTEQARETAAFTGGDTPTAGEGSIFAQFLSAGRAPASL